MRRKARDSGGKIWKVIDPKPDRQPMTYYTTHHSVLCFASNIGLNQMSHAA